MTTQATSLQTIEPLPEFADILRDTGQFAQGGRDSMAERLNRWFDDLLLQSGLGMRPAVFVLLCLFGGLSFSLAAFVVQESQLTAAAGALVGVVMPVVAAMVARRRRQTLLMQQLPAMIDELARAARAGRSLEHCFELVAADTPTPLGDELQQCVRKIQLGMTIPESLRDLPQRTGISVTNVLLMALSVHSQYGGDVVTLLDRLSRTIRDRLQYLGRLRSATAASRATAILMLGLPPAVVLFFVLREPEYLSNLVSSTWGMRATVVALALELIGTMWVLRILKRSEQV